MTSTRGWWLLEIEQGHLARERRKCFTAKYSHSNSAKSAVALFGVLQLSRKEGCGGPAVVDILLKDGTNCGAGGIDYQARHSFWRGMIK